MSAIASRYASLARRITFLNDLIYKALGLKVEGGFSQDELGKDGFVECTEHGFRTLFEELKRLLSDIGNEIRVSPDSDYPHKRQEADWQGELMLLVTQLGLLFDFDFSLEKQIALRKGLSILNGDIRGEEALEGVYDLSMEEDDLDVDAEDQEQAVKSLVAARRRYERQIFSSMSQQFMTFLIAYGQWQFREEEDRELEESA